MPGRAFHTCKILFLLLLCSPKAPEDDPEERLRTHQEACKFIDGRPKVQPLAVRVKGGATEPQVVARLIFIVAYS